MSAYALPGLFPPLPQQECDPDPAPFPDFPMLHEKKAGGSETVQSENEAADRVGISVTEAKIDSALLVQSIAKSEKTTPGSPRSRRRRVGAADSNEESSQQDEAMKFELFVHFGGRRYTTTRSWPSICQFRKDLIRNVRSCDIPELPSLHPPGVLCRSFSFLHNLVSSYVPTLEGWLRTVTDLVPHDNPILSHFLCEFEPDEQYCNQLLKELEKRSSCNQLLDAIEESDSEEEDEEGDEADDGSVRE